MSDPCPSCCEVHPYGDPCIVAPDNLDPDDDAFQCHRHGTITGLTCTECCDEDIAKARRAVLEEADREISRFIGSKEVPFPFHDLQRGYVLGLDKAKELIHTLIEK